MNETYIVPKLLELAKVMYGGEAFANYSKRRDLYIFGSMYPFGKVIKNVVHRSVAIYLAIHQIPKDDTTNSNQSIKHIRSKK